MITMKSSLLRSKEGKQKGQNAWQMLFENDPKRYA